MHDAEESSEDDEAVERAKRALESIAKEIRESGECHQTTPREILGLFGRKKRGRHVRGTIRDALRDAGLEVAPPLNAVSLDDAVKLSLVEAADAVEGEGSGRLPALEGAGHGEAQPQPETDVVALVGTLPTARKGVVSVKRQSRLSEAIALMTCKGYSQLPVLAGERDLVGVISWRCIGAAVAKKIKISGDQEVQSIMRQAPQVCSASEPLLDAMHRVINDEFVFIKDEKKTICGIVTTTDLAKFLQDGYEAFASLAEIEALLRQCLNRHFSPEELAEVRVSGDASRAVNGAQDLTFGEYRRFLERQERWDKLGLRVDRVTFLKQMEDVNRIRNDVMHFAEDGVGDDDVQELRAFLGALRTLFA